MCCGLVFFCCRKKTAYEMRISDWSSDVCSSDLARHVVVRFQERVINAVVGARGGLDRGIGPGLDRDDAGQVDQVGELDHPALVDRTHPMVGEDRKSVVVGKRVSVRVETGGRRIMK